MAINTVGKVIEYHRSLMIGCRDRLLEDKSSETCTVPQTRLATS